MRVEAAAGGLVVHVDDEGDSARLGAAIAAVVAPGTVIGLVGPLGAGKTRLSRAIAEALGVDPRAIASPTFVLIHEYEGIIPIYHFDAYRLDDPNAFDDLGAAEYFDGGGLCLVEWADRVSARLPADAWRIRIEPTGPTSRAYRIEVGEGVATTLRDRLDPGLP